jgi:hypothetical protein
MSDQVAELTLRVLAISSYDDSPLAGTIVILATATELGVSVRARA